MTDTLPPIAPASPAVVLGAVRDTVRELVQTLWAARTPTELLDTIRECERARSALDAVQLAAINEVDATDAAKTDGWGSTQDFLTATTGGTKGSGRRLLTLARAVTSDRATGTALAAGTISRTQADIVVTAVDRLPVDPALRSAAETLLLEAARDHDATDLTRAAAHVLERLDPDGTARADERALDRLERSAHLGRHLSLREDGLGGVTLKGRGTIEDAAWIKTALLPLAAPTPPTAPGDCGGTPGRPDRHCGSSTTATDCAHDGRDPRDHGARMWDALVEATRRLAGTETLPDSHGARPRLSVAINLDDLHADPGTGHDDPHDPHDDLRDDPGTGHDQPQDNKTGRPGTGLLDTGETISAAAVRTLACDADVLPYVLGSRSQILDVGRTSRLVTTAIWLALVLRDQHCTFPGCTRPPLMCDAHHITHWVDGGPTALHNLALLCRTHHTLIHTTPWQIRLNPHDQRPEFLPPPRPDNPHPSPLRRRPLRT